MIAYVAFGSPALSLTLRFSHSTDKEVEGLQCVQGHVARAGWGLSNQSRSLAPEGWEEEGTGDEELPQQFSG